MVEVLPPSEMPLVGFIFRTEDLINTTKYYSKVDMEISRTPEWEMYLKDIHV